MLEHVPSRLLVCFGLEWPLACAADLRVCFATADLFFDEVLRATLAAGAGAGLATGDRRKADGEGMVIVAIGLKNQKQQHMML